MGLRARKIIMAVTLSLVLTGLASFFLFSSTTGSHVLQVQDMSGSMNSSAVRMDVKILMIPMSSGTSVLFPGLLTEKFTLSTIFTLALGTVVAERRSDGPQKLRDRIYSEVCISPGVHLRELQRSVGCAMGALQYHVKALESEGTIISIKNGNAKHFFPSAFSDDDNTLALTALARNPTVQIILQEIMAKGRVTQAELSRTMSIDKSLVSYYTSSLLKADVLSIVRVFGRERPLVLNDWARASLLELALV
jgi:hypothetical protein